MNHALAFRPLKSDDSAVNDLSGASSETLQAAQTKLHTLVKSWPGVDGCGSDGTDLEVYMSDFAFATRVPSQIDGIRVRVTRQQQPKPPGR